MSQSDQRQQGEVGVYTSSAKTDCSTVILVYRNNPSPRFAGDLNRFVALNLHPAPASGLPTCHTLNVWEEIITGSATICLRLCSYYANKSERKTAEKSVLVRLELNGCRSAIHVVRRVGRIDGVSIGPF